MAGKMKKIVIPIDIKKTYLERDGRRIELGKINTETLPSVEEDVVRGKFAEIHMPLETGILSCETTITLKTFIGLLDGVYVRLRNAIIPIAAKDLVWGNNDEAACYVWGWPGPDYNIYSRGNYKTDWAFTKQEIEE